MKFSNTLYDRLKWVAIIIMPAITAFYLGMGELWHWHDTDKVGASLGLATVFLGACLQISNSKYNSDDPDVVGHIDIPGADEDTGNPNVNLTFHGLPHELVAGKKKVKLMVGEVKMPKKRVAKSSVDDIPEH